MFIHSFKNKQTNKPILGHIHSIIQAFGNSYNLRVTMSYLGAIKTIPASKLQKGGYYRFFVISVINILIIS